MSKLITMSKIEIKVHALPTEKALIHLINGTYVWNELHSTAYGCSIPHHLYATTSETPKEGDWFIKDNILYQAVRRPDGVEFVGYYTTDFQYIDKDCRKVVATDDKDLYFQPQEMKTWSDNSPEQISPEFQQAWVREANKGTPIVDAMVEMAEERHMMGVDIDDNSKINYDIITYPKLNPQGYVTILPVKEKMYTAQELKTYCAAAFIRKDVKGGLAFDYTDGAFDSWAKQNL